jgi:hypothetical protein
MRRHVDIVFLVVLILVAGYFGHLVQVDQQRDCDRSKAIRHFLRSDARLRERNANASTENVASWDDIPIHDPAFRMFLAAEAHIRVGNARRSISAAADWRSTGDKIVAEAC